MSEALGKVGLPRKTGQEAFYGGDDKAGFSVLDFWRWGFSDFLNNATRGVVAEFLVAKALGIPTDGVRESWASWDLETPRGLKVEVKSAAYLQSWHQDRLSKISFGIGERSGWDSFTGRSEAVARRQADVYVFALLNHESKRTVDPLNLQQWWFFVLSTTRLNEALPSQESIGLTTLKKLAGTGCGFAHLKAALEGIEVQHKVPPSR